MNENKRRILKSLPLAAVTASWTEPVIKSIVLPAHAQTTTAGGTGNVIAATAPCQIPGVNLTCPTDPLVLFQVNNQNRFRIIANQTGCTVVGPETGGNMPGTILVSAGSTITTTQTLQRFIFPNNLAGGQLIFPGFFGTTLRDQILTLNDHTFFITVQTRNLAGAIINTRSVVFDCEEVGIVTSCEYRTVPNPFVAPLPLVPGSDGSCPTIINTIGNTSVINPSGVNAISPDQPGAFNLAAVDDLGNTRTISGVISITGNSITLSAMPVV